MESSSSPSWAPTDWNGYNMNVSTYTLSNHTSGAVECHAILSKHPEWDQGPHRLQLQGISDVAGIEQKVDHINPASWKGNVHVANVQLASAWRAGHHLVEHDKDLVEFHLAYKFKNLEAQKGANLLNPFGSAAYEDHEDGIEEHTPTQENPVPIETFNLSDIVDKECTHHSGLSCTIELPDGKRVHKVRVLCKFMKYSR